MKKYLEVLIYTICAVAGSIIVGLIVYGPRIFSLKDRSLEFVTIGVIGALIFAVTKYYRKWAGALLVLVIALIHFISYRVLKIHNVYVIIYVLWILAKGYTIFGVACLFGTRIKKLPIGKFLVLGIILGILYGILYFVSTVPFVRPVPANIILVHAIRGFLIGCGLGIGIEIAELINRFFSKSKAAIQTD